MTTPEIAHELEISDEVVRNDKRIIKSELPTYAEQYDTLMQQCFLTMGRLFLAENWEDYNRVSSVLYRTASLIAKHTDNTTRPELLDAMDDYVNAVIDSRDNGEG